MARSMSCTELKFMARLPLFHSTGHRCSCHGDGEIYERFETVARQRLQLIREEQPHPDEPRVE